MAQFPKAEVDVSALVMSMIAGYGTHAALPVTLAGHNWNTA